MEATVREIIEDMEARPTQKPRHRRKLSPYVCIGLMFILVTGILLGYVAQKWTIISLGYEVEHRQAKLNELQMENQYLRLQKAAARSPKRIEQLAKERMGMVEPLKPEHIVVELPTKPQSSGQVEPVVESSGLLATISSFLGQLISGDQPVQAGKIGQ
ncbi:MAG: cell division protein FtsL [Limnochordia bacterium]|jgi:cell division protein FtsL|nr:cell division protein FtsL [Limnochordia bacterium]MDD2629630.1 cell division protein FtsL [Limnochordia bacterium]MDD4516963.1 cell division protein FtsL [Limnochordia bacterium]